jgi:FecR protein
VESGVIRGSLGAVLGALALLALALLAPARVLADDESADLPSRVGRISEIAGELFLATQDRANEWAPIGLNYPVTSGDNLWVSANGRAEIDFGGGRFRMAGDTNLQLTSLDDRQLALFVASGRVILRIRGLEPGEVAHIDTPNTQIDIDRPGQYRVDVDSDRQRTTLTVREGEAGIRFAAGVQQTLPGQAATVMGIDGAGLAIQSGFGSDGFDTWSAARDQRYESSRGAAYVSPEMIGARDLDDYGTWEATPTYGPVWYPSTVAVGWAPYRFGNWTWVAPWGWTWVDAAPWGYAPFHYGRWVWTSGRWGWSPGTRGARPAWAPALVGWYGGQGWANAGAPVYGWVPLGWGEAYTPSWGRCSGRCYRQFNQPYAVAQTDRRAMNAPQRYANSQVPGAMTAVTAAVLSGARPVAPNQVSIGGLAGATAPVLASAPPVAPQSGRSLQRTIPSAPMPASAQFKTLNRNDVRMGAPPPVTTPMIAGPVAPAPQGAASQAGTAPRLVAAPPALTPANGGRTVAAPPIRDVRATVTPVQAAPSSAAAQMYGGVPAARGAYTGVAPTPGPKAPTVVDRGIAVPQTGQAMAPRVAPVAVPPRVAPQPGAQGALQDAAAHPSGPTRVAPRTAPAATGESNAPPPK